MQQRSFIDGVADFDALQTNFPRFRFCSRFTVSLNFWFENHIAEKLSSLVKESSYSKTAMHLTPAEDLAFKRYIESIVYNVTKSFTKVGNLTSFPGSQNKYSTRSPTPSRRLSCLCLRIFGLRHRPSKRAWKDVFYDILKMLM